MGDGQGEVTGLLLQMQAGHSPARDKLMELLYEELHRIARLRLHAERPAHTLQPTALINEAYVKVFAGCQLNFADRTHFLATMSVAMRRILVDHARSRNGAKRGGNYQRVSLGERDEPIQDADALQLLSLDAAIHALAAERERAAQLVEMHYFGGMTADEIAAATGISIHMVRQHLRFAQAWLRRYMNLSK